MRVVVTGGTGFIGARLSAHLVSAGHDVVVPTRDPDRAARLLPAGVRAVAWGGADTSWEASVDGAGAVVNLAGETVAQRWTAAAKARIVGSRLEAVARIERAIGAATVPPSVLVNASAVGYYGHRDAGDLTEESPPGDDFLATTCVAWEEAARRVEALGPRVVRVRIGVVLGEEGGALAKMLLPFRLGVGGPLGSGRQWMPWIHRDDLVSLLAWALLEPAVSGPLNGTAPDPVRMTDFARALGRVLHRPSFAPAPAFALKLLMGEMSGIVLSGQRAVPAKALQLGFRFRHTDLSLALADLLG